MKMESTLSVIDLHGNRVPMLAFSFEDADGAVCVADFSPKRLLLADQDEKYYQLVDEEGFEYARVKKSEEWIQAAVSAGLFVLSMRTPLPATQDHVGGRFMMVQFPFGQIIQDSGTFSVRKGDLAKLEKSPKDFDKLRDRAEAAFKQLAGTSKLPN